MKNREKYAQEIVQIALDGGPMALVNGKPLSCFDTKCVNCDLEDLCSLDGAYGVKKHRAAVREWAEKEAET